MISGKDIRGRKEVIYLHTSGWCIRKDCRGEQYYTYFVITDTFAWSVYWPGQVALMEQRELALIQKLKNTQVVPPPHNPLYLVETPCF